MENLNLDIATISGTYQEGFLYKREARRIILKKIYDGIIGLAIGDALGVPFEFKSRTEISKNPIVNMCEYGTHNQPMGTWSDDTSLTLALIDSLVKNEGINYNDIMNKFSSWLMYGEYTATGEVFDVGNSTSRAIMNYGRGINPLECGGASEYENGNGSLMRILPIAYYLSMQNDNSMEYRMNIVRNISSLTHRHSISIVGCGIYISVALQMLKCELSLFECVKQGTKEAIEYYENKMIDGVNAYIRLRDIQIFSNVSESDIRSSGYVADTLEAAIWCLLNTDSFESCVLKAVNLGDDTDTVGAVAGGLAGIYYGIDNIPKEWLEVVIRKEYIEELCEKMQKIISLN